MEREKEEIVVSKYNQIKNGLNTVKLWLNNETCKIELESDFSDYIDIHWWQVVRKDACDIEL